MRTQEQVCRKLEFYANVYFAIYPIHPQSKVRPTGEQYAKEQEKFKHYLDTQGADLSKTSEFLPFYALPYIQNPAEHPSFQYLFSEQWTGELRSRLCAIVAEVSSQNPALQPALLQMF